MELALLKACHNATVRSISLPDTNPIHQIISNAKRNPPTKHLSPIDNSLKLFSLNNIKVETIHPTVTLKQPPPRYSMKIDTDREASILAESVDDADYKLFSDGSGQDNGIGAASILYEKGRARPLRSLQAYMGTSDKHNTYEAEAMGALLALWILRTTPETRGKKVTLYIDNQSIITALTSIKSTSGQYLLHELRQAANSSSSKLSIRWISSHSNVKGNEDVDKMAKDAAAGRSSAMSSLPHILRHPLPTSTSALKQDFKDRLKTKWAAMWDASPRKPRMSQFGDTFPYSTFLNKLFSLTRKQSSTILQIRCGHFPLNKYLHKINRSDTEKCQACEGQQEDNPPAESFNHFLFDCPAHTLARDELIENIDRDNFYLEDIMNDIDRMKALITFINRTRRFRD
jgi:ribonuclease HI